MRFLACFLLSLSIFAVVIPASAGSRSEAFGRFAKTETKAAAQAQEAALASQRAMDARVKLQAQQTELARRSHAAESAKQAADLSRHLGYTEKYGQAGVKELENGRIRYYGELTPARNSGEMAGARLVREWNPATANARMWYETLDNAGTVRSVAPKPVTEPLNHRIFNANGNYTGRR